MEKECYSRLKFSEQQVDEDFSLYRTGFENKIQNLIDDPNNIELRKEIFKSQNNHKKDRNKENQENENEDEDDVENDVVYTVLKEKGL